MKYRLGNAISLQDNLQYIKSTKTHQFGTASYNNAGHLLDKYQFNILNISYTS